MKKMHVLIIALIVSFMIPGCQAENNLASESAPEIISTPMTHSNMPVPTASPMPSPTPTLEPPVQILLPVELGINGSLFYGINRQDVIDIMGTPDFTSDPEQALPPEFENVDTSELYSDFLTYIKDFNGFEDAMFVFQFYHHKNKTTDKFYGLERILISIKGSEKQCEKFLAESSNIFSSLYGEAFLNLPDRVITEWVGDDEGNPDVLFYTYSDGTNKYAEIKCSKHTPYSEIAKQEDEEAYFASIQSGVTLDNYNHIKEGMAYDKVIKYLGRGKKTGETKIGGSTYVHYEWHSDSGATVRIQFEDDKVNIITLIGNLF